MSVSPDEIHEAERLAERLAQLPEVSGRGDAMHDEAGTLAHALDDLESSCRRLLTELLPKIREEPLSNEELYDVLLEIGEELRHIRYHTRDPEFFAYLEEQTEAAAGG
ncbi:MAG: hypothetical protein BRD37_04120 [Bacteroidetes bacterium QH_8_67_23]|nr:MAG: hypothetical protein BRD37_04120 [Bacteroidetes bacterium QH_8_67_23]